MKVFLVGAGPGDPGLLTLRGAELLGMADVIVYDALANPALLKRANPAAELIYVGKIAGNHALPQDKINELLAEKALAGLNVVRLKGGDPYIFGRGGEEGEYLAARGIPFEEVPGITSAIAAPAYAGIPLTHRDLVSAVTIITGHERGDRAESVHAWKAYVDSGSTLVFVMGVKQLPHITESLLAAGMAESMPCAIVYRGTTPMQRVLVSTLGNLAREADEAGFSNPSVIVVGKVAALHETLGWFGKGPLAGRTIVVTRAREQASDTVRAFTELGANVLECPTIEIVPLPEEWGRRGIIRSVIRYDWVIFTSVNGVKYFWQELEKERGDARALWRAEVVAIGPATAAALAERGVRANLVPSSYVAEGVVDALVKRYGENMQGRRFLIPRAKGARNVLPDALDAMGAEVTVLELYEARPAGACKDELVAALNANLVDCITFGSSSTVDNFFKMIPPEVLAQHPGIALAPIGPVTADTLRKYGFAPTIIPEEYTIPALVKAVTNYFDSRENI